jgi:hypothetical protein
MLIKVRQFLTKSEVNPVPLRTMRIAEQGKETPKAVYVKLVGTPLPQANCVHCGREITHPQSLYLGIGSTCVKKYPQLLESIDYDDVEQSYKNLKTTMANITWEGWLPKAHIEMTPELFYNVTFTHNSTEYRTKTQDLDKIEKIKANDPNAKIEEILL